VKHISSLLDGAIAFGEEDMMVFLDDID